MYKRILVPTDGKPPVGEAVETAVDLAQQLGAGIHVVHVVQPEPIAGMSMETAWAGVSDLARQEGEATIATVEERLASTDVPFETAILEGTPSRAICEAAEHRDCGLIIMATSGRGGLDRLLLGSVTEHVVRHASVPVLTVSRNGANQIEETPTNANVSG